MTEFVVHTIPGSPFARSVMAALEEKRLRWRLEPLAVGEHKSEAHLARHPFGRMPTLTQGDFALYETQAILRYLDRAHPSPALTPSDPKIAARMDQAMAVYDWYLFPNCASVILFNRVVGPAVLGLVPDEAAIAEAAPRARLALRELSRLLGDRAWFGGDAFSLADLLLAPAVEFFRRTPEWADLSRDQGNLERWSVRAEARPSLAAVTWERVSDMAARLRPQVWAAPAAGLSSQPPGAR